MVWSTYFNRFLLTLTVILAFFQSPVSAQAKVLFEGYSKILVSGNHVGYVIQRYELDEKKKEFLSTYYIRGKNGPSEFVESLQARCNSAFTPISYQYTSQMGEKVKTIDAKFSGGKMSAVVSDGKINNNINLDIPSGTFLSTFQGYLMLKNGVSVGKKYQFTAIAEEDAKLAKGEALIDKEEIYNGQESYKILNSFVGQQFISYMTYKGHVLGTSSPAQQVATELVASRALAVGAFPFATKSIKILFGKIPEGTTHALAGAKMAPQRKGASNESKPPKKAGP